MNDMTINFNKKNYLAKYNKQTGYYEVDLQAPEKGGIYNVDITFVDLIGQTYDESQNVQIWKKEINKIETDKVFMWIFDYKDFLVKDIVEISDYEINIDEETNANSLIKVIKKTKAMSGDIIVIKKNNKCIYWGILDNIKNEDGKLLYEYTLKYITNLFDQKIRIGNTSLINSKGIEDFIADEIIYNFINNEDTFINKSYIEIKVKTHTKKQISVTNVENGIYNLHTWITNCTQNYDIVYEFTIENNKLMITIENKSYKKELIDTKALAISNYTEVFETNIISKVIVLTNTYTYTLYLLNDRTTTTDMTNKNRVEGKIETVFVENYEEAHQKALDVIKTNKYNHNITFDLYDKYMKIGTPIAIKTKESIIYDTYISAIKITPKRFIEYTCGNIRIKFIDKLLKERRK